MLNVGSHIDKNEVIENKDRKFGSDTEYFPCYVTKRTGETVPALFTRDAINEAIKRAALNPEDCNWGPPS